MNPTIYPAHSRRSHFQSVATLATVALFFSGLSFMLNYPPARIIGFTISVIVAYIVWLITALRLKKSFPKTGEEKYLEAIFPYFFKLVYTIRRNGFYTLIAFLLIAIIAGIANPSFGLFGAAAAGWIFRVAISMFEQMENRELSLAVKEHSGKAVAETRIGLYLMVHVQDDIRKKFSQRQRTYLLFCIPVWLLIANSVPAVYFPHLLCCAIMLIAVYQEYQRLDFSTKMAAEAREYCS